MAELVWSLNGKYFKDFGVGISSSDGILGELKPKKQDTKDWPEYNGSALDLTKKPKYEAREFTLSGWIVGADWLTMLNNFNTLFGEFRNAGKQRLLLDVFGQKTLVFDVRCDDEIELKKTFKQGKMFGMFSLKLIEHNPIKKILYTANSNLQLAFNTPKWVEVNIDGKIDVYKGTVNINKTLTNRVVTGYNFGGRNLLKFSKDFGGWGKQGFVDVGMVADYKGFKVSKAQEPWSYYAQLFNFQASETYTISGYVLGYYGTKAIFGALKGYVKNQVLSGEWERFIHTFTVQPQDAGNYLVRLESDSNYLLVCGLKLEKGNKATDWTPAPEDQHFVSIAGNIDEITNLTTNATVLWERL